MGGGTGIALWLGDAGGLVGLVVSTRPLDVERGMRAWIWPPKELPGVDEIESGLREFLGYWFAGLMQGLAELDEASRIKIWHECGKACAQSYTAQVFREARQSSTDTGSFLRNLSLRFPGATYEQTDPHMIRVTYSQCGCDLVRLGLVTSPSFCECSVANLQENFRQGLGVPATVTLETSILRGGTHCALKVWLDDEG
jgi:hypothetical protein